MTASLHNGIQVTAALVVHRHLVRGLLLTCLLVASPGVRADLSAEEIYSTRIGSIFTIVAERGESDSVIGSGFILTENGIAATAYHVVANATHVEAKFANGEVFEVSGIVDADSKRDVALIRVKAFGITPIQPASGAPSVGQQAFVIGAPKGFEFSMSDGIVSQTRIIEGVPVIQYTCPTSPGNSGGPLLDSNGNAIGIVSFQVGSGQNLNFAIPIRYVLGLDRTLATSPWEKYDYEGVTELLATSDVATFDLAIRDLWTTLVDSGIVMRVLWETVTQKRSGYRSGISPKAYAMIEKLKRQTNRFETIRVVDSDRQILATQLASFANEWIEGMNGLFDAIRSAQQNNGWTASINDHAARSFAKMLGPTEFPLWHDLRDVLRELPDDEFPLWIRYFSGVGDDPTKYVLGVYLLSDYPKLLYSVQKSSVADKLGLKAGDRLSSMNGEPMSNYLEFKQALLSHQNKRVEIIVERDGQFKRLRPRVPKIDTR